MVPTIISSLSAFVLSHMFVFLTHGEVSPGEFLILNVIIFIHISNIITKEEEKADEAL